ncbi:MAG: hypothetical protein RL474_330, partial [Pseudomonadota bacterium]
MQLKQLLLGLCVLLGMTTGAWAQKYPDRPIKWIVPYP